MNPLLLIWILGAVVIAFAMLVAIAFLARRSIRKEYARLSADAEKKLRGSSSRPAERPGVKKGGGQ